VKKPRRKLSAAGKAEKRRRRKEYMTIFVHGKQMRVERPQTIEGLDADEFIRRNADPIWLHQNEIRNGNQFFWFDEVTTAALQLSFEKRAQLAGKLLFSLDSYLYYPINHSRATV
jgi:hypothetical protein